MAGTQPCHFFQFGRCKNGDACIYAHTINPEFKPKPCQYFTKGKCYKGKNCTFLHAQEDIGSTKAAKSTTNATASTNDAPEQRVIDTNTQSTFQAWISQIPSSDFDEAPQLFGAIANFFQQARKLAEVGAGVAQEVIFALASEGGMRRIGELVNRPFPDVMSDRVLSDRFDKQIIPFFQLLSLKHVDRSALLEGRVAWIYVYLFGNGGKRACPLFVAAARYLKLIVKPEATEADRAAAESVLTVLAKVVEVNGTAQVTEALIPIVERIANVLQPADPQQEPFSHVALRRLSAIQQRFNIGANIPHAGSAIDTSAKPTFDTPRDLPGDLSHEGPRHDNDFSDIRQIKIMPTLQEIQSSRNEYLPPLDQTEWHVRGLRGLLDRQFRLLREDTVGQVRDVAGFELQTLQDPIDVVGRQGDKHQSARRFVYQNLRFEDFGFDSLKGLEFAVSFDQPPHLRHLPTDARRQWWEGSRRLGGDALVCLLDAAGSAAFLIVSMAPEFSDKTSKKGAPPTHHLHKVFNRHDDPFRASAVVRFAEYSEVTAKQIIGFFDSANRGAPMSLVEFPGVLVPAFLPTLSALQKMSTSSDLPFDNLILQNSDGHVPPPAYATAAAFRYKLDAVTNGRPQTLRLDNTGAAVHFDMDAFTASTSLDSGQADAFISSLSRSFALVQGPPGTGKSYTGVSLIRTLLDNKTDADLGPIICVCYTNHALDQLLEHLIDAGVTQVVRVGSRSKSVKLTELNLREVSRRMARTKTEKSEKWRLKGAITRVGQDMTAILRSLGECGSQASVGRFLLAKFPEQYAHLFALVDSDGYEEVDHHPETRLERWRRGLLFPVQSAAPIRPLEELLIENMREVSLKERATLYDFWVSQTKLELRGKLASSLQEYTITKRASDILRAEIDLRALSQAHIIGLTTSGLARNLPLLRKLTSKVLVCEEAGEVQEAHLLTALLPSLEHVILIGDHLQLRPQVQRYDLSSESDEGKQYCLDISLFERLVNPLVPKIKPLPYCTLETQRRMHPSVSELIRSTLYPRLLDAPTVLEYPQVSGMRHRLFWLDHEHAENGKSNDIQSSSHSNDWEIDMTEALVTHIVRQGIYKPSDIAVLTPYLGQLARLRERMSEKFEIILGEGDDGDLGPGAADGDEGDGESVSDSSSDGGSEDLPIQRNNATRGTLLDALRLATVDNFQGEEAKVVIISLVRCNKQHKPGFLRTPNRANVLLSRAKHGMYIIGNAETAGAAPIWATVIDILQKEGNFGRTLELNCPRHPEKILKVKEPDDFLAFAPEGGCNAMCNEQLPCACPRPMEGCQHLCQRPCGQKCSLHCEVMITDLNLELECGHVKTELPCWQYQDLFTVTCRVEVSKNVPGCNHTSLVACHTDVTDPDYVCVADCAASKSCGHRCSKKCYTCNKMREDTMETDHGECQSVCGRKYALCKHSDTGSCHEGQCSPCSAISDIRCSHSKSTRLCSEPPIPCAEEHCASANSHSACTVPCAAPCDHIPSSERCTKRLSCGCQCVSVDGEACPSARYCQVHGVEEVLAQEVDFIEFTEYKDVNLDEDPCIVLQCGHIFTIGTLDGLMCLSDYYEIDDQGHPTAIKTSSQPFSRDELKACPNCRGTMSDIARYGRIVRRALLDESTKRFITWSNNKYVPIAEWFLRQQDLLVASLDGAKLAHKSMRLLGSRDDQIVAIRRSGLARYSAVFAARRRIIGFHQDVQFSEQPFQRVRDLVETARRRKAGEGVEIAPFDFDQSLLQTRASLLGLALLLRCDALILSDALTARQNTPANHVGDELVVDFSANRGDCETLIAEAQKSRQILQQVEGHIFWARFASLERTASPVEEGVALDGVERPMTRLRMEALVHLDEAEALCTANPGQTRAVSDEVGSTRKMLSDSVFYSAVSSDEMRAVVAAMSSEFSVTGHWYTCANGHPFTIGECGGPMETSRCPQCGGTIGGQGHLAAEGVTRARHIEEAFSGQ